VGTYVEEIEYRADIDDVRQKLAQLERHTRDAEDTTRDATSKAGGYWSSFGDRVHGAGSRVIGAAMDVGRYAVAGLGAGAAAAVGLGLKTAASMETAQIGFETMLGSADKAGKFLKDLQAFAAKTPFEFPELQTAASSLISVGFATKDVIPMMTTLGNVTSGMGTGSEGIKRATVALQQMSAAGRITGEDLNQLRDAGVPVFDLLAAATGKSKEEVAALAQAGKLGKDEMNQLFEALKTGKGLERFNGLMEKQSASLSGMFSTLKDTVQMGLAGAVEPVVPLLSAAIPKAAALATTAFASLGPMLSNFIGQAVALIDVIRGGDDVAQGAGEIIDSMFGNTGALVGPVREFVLVLEDVWTVIREGVLPVFAELYSTMPSFLTPLGLARDLLGFVADHATVLQPILAGLLAGFIAYRTVTGIIQAITIAQMAWNAVMAMNPIGFVVMALAGLAAMLVYAYNNSETFRAVVQGAFDSVKNAAAVAGDAIYGAATWIGAVFTWVVGTVTGLPGRIRAAAGGMWDGLKDAFRSAINFIIRAWNSLEFRVPGFSAGPVQFAGFTLGVPDIPMLANGGITRGPVVAGLGDNRSGREMIVPLERAGEMGFGGGSTTIVVQVDAGVIANQVQLESTLQEIVGRALARGNVDPSLADGIRRIANS
jgi:tape measure domain-containing protein